MWVLVFDSVSRPTSVPPPSHLRPASVPPPPPPLPPCPTPPSFTHNFVTHNFVTHTSTFTLRGGRGTSRHPPSFCVAGVALTALGWLRWHAWAPLGGRWSRGDAAALCVAGVALGGIHLYFAWQAWRFTTSTCVFCVAGVAQRHWAGSAGVLGRCLGAAGSAGDIDLRFAWQVWRLRHWAGSGGALGRRLTLCGRGGTWRHPPSLCTACVALHDIDLRFAWQVWRLRHWACRGTLRGRCGTWRHLRHWSGSAAWAPLVAGDAAALCVAGVALGDMDLRFAWQA